MTSPPPCITVKTVTVPGAPSPIHITSHSDTILHGAADLNITRTDGRLLRRQDATLAHDNDINSRTARTEQRSRRMHHSRVSVLLEPAAAANGRNQLHVPPPGLVHPVLALLLLPLVLLLHLLRGAGLLRPSRDLGLWPARAPAASTSTTLGRGRACAPRTSSWRHFICQVQCQWKLGSGRWTRCRSTLVEALIAYYCPGPSRIGTRDLGKVSGSRNL